MGKQSQAIKKPHRGCMADTGYYQAFQHDSQCLHLPVMVKIMLA